MNTEPTDDGEISLAELLTTIVRNRKKVAAWTVAVGLVAGLTAVRRPLEYMATATFATQGGSQSMSSLASIAGQLGLAASSSSPSWSPDFYIMLMKSPVLLSKVIRDTFVVSEMGGRKLTIGQVLEVKGRDSVELEQRAMDAVRSMMVAERQRSTGLVQVNVLTPWPSVSLALVSSFLSAVDTYNRESRRSQAAVERQFIETRLAEALIDLRQAEDRLQGFLASNREMLSMSQLAFERDRLSRAVQLKQQVYTTIATSFEDARIREVRDTPVISVIEPPRVKRDPEPRARWKRWAIGMVIGMLFGLLVTLLSEGALRLVRQDTGDAEELRASLREAKDGLRRALSLNR